MPNILATISAASPVIKETAMETYSIVFLVVSLALFVIFLIAVASQSYKSANYFILSIFFYVVHIVVYWASHGSLLEYTDFLGRFFLGLFLTPVVLIAGAVLSPLFLILMFFGGSSKD